MPMNHNNLPFSTNMMCAHRHQSASNTTIQTIREKKNLMPFLLHGISNKLARRTWKNRKMNIHFRNNTYPLVSRRTFGAFKYSSTIVLKMESCKFIKLQKLGFSARQEHQKYINRVHKCGHQNYTGGYAADVLIYDRKVWF